ncbi:MAG: beta-N-acetylhexosaminidase [Cyclobacteriaceae bacterium]|nr:beta-N-acetylhexosaminidase [Cyclobacteriaceae bacterium SS2]
MNIRTLWICLAIVGKVFIDSCNASELSSLGLHVIPYPQKVSLGGEAFVLHSTVNIVLDNGSSEVDRKTAGLLKQNLEEKWGIEAIVTHTKGNSNIILTSLAKSNKIREQGYQLKTSEDDLTITSKDEDGLFYGIQTLLQVIKKSRNKIYVPAMHIEDWPDVKIRAVHYDTKHHQDKASYVKSFIRDMAKYKINMLVWEWEDKLAYETHSEIGAPGAFTIQEMQEFTSYAKEYHIELVPLVQGLGHVSYILKWPQYRHLREIEDSDWEFCPLEEGTYDLLFDLWDEAIKATPTSEYIHIGSDETYELGVCDKCKAKALEIGNSGLYHLFIDKAAKHIGKSRKVMVWERPMGWELSKSPIKNMKPHKGLVLTESYDYSPENNHAALAKSKGFEVFMYDPNPGIEPLFLPYHYKEKKGEIKNGSLKDSYDFLSVRAGAPEFDGMINTSWDDSGLHNQMWMLSFVTSAQYSWNGGAPSLDEFENTFFANYYGTESKDMKELYQLLNEGAYYYYATLERHVWHAGDIGKTHLPDLPRGQYIEYDPFWNREYLEVVKRSEKMQQKMLRASQIIAINRQQNLENKYDFDIYKSIVDLISHTCLLYQDLSQLEHTITAAHKQAFTNRSEALSYLKSAEQIIDSSLERREQVYSELVKTWEETRLPKGLSLPEKKFFHKMDRSRHFANRTADMSYLILDEQLLDLEGYLEKLRQYIEAFKLEY